MDRTILPITSRLLQGSRSVSSMTSISTPSFTRGRDQTQTQNQSRTKVHRTLRPFSASALSEEIAAKPRRSPPAKKDPIIITERAASRIKELLSSPNGANALGIRLGVKRRGCNGLSYTLNYAEEVQPNEEEMEAHGVKVFIEPMALFSVVGTVMDYEITDMSSEFTFENPNSKGECGCGESFNV